MKDKKSGVLGAYGGWQLCALCLAKETAIPVGIGRMPVLARETEVRRWAHEWVYASVSSVIYIHVCVLKHLQCTHPAFTQAISGQLQIQMWRSYPSMMLALKAPNSLLPRETQTNAAKKETWLMAIYTICRVTRRVPPKLCASETSVFKCMQLADWLCVKASMPGTVLGAL